ncbi:MAG: hypothetical protein MI799_14305 [Desulfobacterales bacterium]|nr:hypothetical protein [Desulfobacterales bacterium]
MLIGVDLIEKKDDGYGLTPVLKDFLVKDSPANQLGADVNLMRKGVFV